MEESRRPPERMSAGAFFAVLAAALVVASPLSGGAASTPAPCKYEENCECGVPGITLRWKAAHCMNLAETDDLENEDVQRCLVAPDPDAVRKLGPCEQNAHWKTMLCRAVRDAHDVQECVRDKTFVPPFVEAGPGS